MMIEQREKFENEAFAVRIATYGSNPQEYAETVFPEWFGTEPNLDRLDEYDSVLYDFDNDEEMMTPAKMERLLGQFN